MKELLLSLILKDARKVARHEARYTALAWFNDWVVSAGEIVEVLAERTWTADEAGDPKAGIDDQHAIPIERETTGEH